MFLTGKSRRLASVLIGLAGALAGLFAYHLGLSASRGLSAGKVALVAVSLFAVLCGALGRRSLHAYKALAILLLNTIVLLILLEFSLIVVARSIDFLPRAKSRDNTHPDLRYAGDGREEIPYFKNQPWAKDYWREYHAAWDARPPAYRPYLIWRIRPFAGKTLNVDDMGLRVTPGAACTPGSYRVYTFGGSTMWGTGVPDWGTIPAILQSRMTQEYVRSICVVNYGEQGYASTQDTIQLLLLLQASYAPDLALFYDGINDVFAAYESGVPGSHQGARRVAAILENRRENTPLIDLISVTRTYKLWRRLALGERGKDVLAYQRSGVDTKTLTNGIVRSYLGNYEIIRALADAYGFRVQFFWQTSLFTDTKPLTEVESSIKRAADRAYPGLADLFRRVGAEVEEKSRRRPYIHHITDVFRNRPEQIFIDPFHVTIQGNELIVTAMQEFIHVE